MATIKQTIIHLEPIADDRNTVTVEYLHNADLDTIVNKYLKGYRKGLSNYIVTEHSIINNHALIQGYIQQGNCPTQIIILDKLS